MKKYGYAIRTVIILLTGVTLMLGLFGCGAKKYRVDYGGRKMMFSEAKDEYRAGETVTVCFSFIATDTDYRFYLDGESISCDYDDGKGFVISFTMPEHDVTLTVESRNSMVEYPDPGDEKKEATLALSSFDGGGPEYTVLIDDPSIVYFETERVYSDPDHEELDGAGYELVCTFTGLQPGTTYVTVKTSSPYDEPDAHYTVTVDGDLYVTVTEQQPDPE